MLGQRIGIFVVIGGKLELIAGIGPAQFRNISLEVLYNPAREEDMNVEGNAEFYLPADAGLRLAAKAAIAAGIPVVSAEAGVEIGGKLGLEAEVKAPLKVNWTPKKGLVIDQLISASVKPVFVFDITGYVSVDADLLLDTVNLYSERWKLYEKSIGSGYDMGISMPFHYEEGKPFNPSLNDIKVTYPDIKPKALLGNVFDEIT